MSARPAGLAPLKSGEYDRLLRRWGFTPIEHGGNHPMYLAPNGITRFPISAADKVTQRELRQAAKIAGVSRRAFLAGPPKSRPMRTVPVDPDEEIRKAQAEMDELAVIAEQRAKEKRMAKVIEEKRPYTKGVGERVERYVKSHPNQELRIKEIEAAVGSTGKGTVGLALKRMTDSDPLMRLVGRGTYVYGEKEKPKRRVEASPRNGNLRNEILRLLEENEGRPMSVDMVVDKLGTVRSSTTNALLQLSRIGAIQQLGRGIYQFKMPEQAQGFVSDETPMVSSHPDDEPIDLVPTEQEYTKSWLSAGERLSTALASSPQYSLWEEMKDLGDGRFLLRDDSGELWVAKMQKLELI